MSTEEKPLLETTKARYYNATAVVENLRKSLNALEGKGVRWNINGSDASWEWSHGSDVYAGSMDSHHHTGADLHVTNLASLADQAVRSIAKIEEIKF